MVSARIPEGDQSRLLQELDAHAARVPPGAAALFLQVARTIGDAHDPATIDAVVAASRGLLEGAQGCLDRFEVRRPEVSLFGAWFAVFNVRLAVEPGHVPRPSATFEVLLALGLLI